MSRERSGDREAGDTPGAGVAVSVCRSGKENPPAIPVNSLVEQYQSIRAEIGTAVTGVLASGEYERGEELWAFEREFAAYLGVRWTIPVGSGYAALFLALRSLGVGEGDEVITAPNTDITTCAAISHCGATVVWADVEQETFNLDPIEVARRITARTRAIIAVHMYGLPADLTRLQPLAERHELTLIEDSALAFGATIGEQRAGSIGRLGCFSFAPHKILGAYGDGGAIVTDDEELAQRARLLAGYGEPYRESMAGPDGRMNLLTEGHHNHLDLVQAAILRVKLRYVDGWIAARRERARWYDMLLTGSGVITPHVPSGLQHSYRNYVVRVPQRDLVRARLAERGIETSLLYLPPLHLQPAYRRYGLGPGAFPVTERLADELLCLPMYPELPEAAVHRVARELLI